MKSSFIPSSSVLTHMDIFPHTNTMNMCIQHVWDRKWGQEIKGMEPFKPNTGCLKKELNTIFHSSLSKTSIDSSAINQRQGQERASISLFCLSYYLMSAWIARMGTLYLVKVVIATCFFPLSSVILGHAKFYRNFKAKWINFIAVNYFSDAVLVLRAITSKEDSSLSLWIPLA